MGPGKRLEAVIGRALIGRTVLSTTDRRLYNVVAHSPSSIRARAWHPMFHVKRTVPMYYGPSTGTDQYAAPRARRQKWLGHHCQGSQAVPLHFWRISENIDSSRNPYHL